MARTLGTYNLIRGWGLPEQLVNVGRREPSPLSPETLRVD